MDFKVRFKFNTLTGEVELFEVDHQGDQFLSDADHNHQHDEVTAELGRLLERFPRIQEIEDGLEVSLETESGGEETPPIEEDDTNTTPDEKTRTTQ